MVGPEEVKQVKEEATEVSYIDSLEGYKGAYETKEYRNVFLECGYSEEQINTKLNNAWDSIFYGGESTRIYYEVGENEAYILDTGNLDVRSEGMSYGMMICVQMNKKEEFDRLWRWAKTHMQIESGANEGYFRWSMDPDGTPKSHGPAPDGEEYFALSLFFASNRWGDGEAPYDYSEQARYILRQAIHQEDDGMGRNMWEVEKKLIKFVPDSLFTDPSYHLPHFYELFALWADEEDRQFWKEAATASREYLKLACHPKTGLAPDYATYEGEPVEYNGPHNLFMSDAYRVAGNIGLDYMWFAADPWQIEQSNRIQAFFIVQGIGRHYSNYSIDGEPQPGSDYQSTGLVAMNAMASLAAYGPNVKPMVDDLWRKAPAVGKWRYYDDCLYFFSLLALSGNYRIWE
ncbi:xylanase [Mobilitalea sibirica]|uniref:Xylanase n=2 Tax=Mobilitalea sibirica TaxID=1462919 RepID=A0A8J7H3Y0_9FIRM|nr:xylanase [Mobilitalea sibirica]